MNKRAAIIFTLTGAISLAWWSIYSSLGSGKIDTGPYGALGEASARRIAAALHDKGRVVLVDADLGEYKILAPINAAQIAAFRKALRRTQIEIAAIEKIPVATPSMSRNGIFMQPGKLPDLLARHAAVDAVVLFVGLAGPEELHDQATQIRRPKVMVISNYDRYYKSLLLSRRLDLAILPNPEDPPVAGYSGKLEDWFGRHYRVISPETASQLPE